MQCGFCLFAFNCGEELRKAYRILPEPVPSNILLCEMVPSSISLFWKGGYN